MTVWWPASIEARSPEIAIAVPVGRRAAGRLRPPSSKSLTHRAFALALLARERTVVTRPLQAEDTDLFLAALAALGCTCETVGDGVEIVPPSVFPATADLFCGNAGTMFRFLVAIAAALPGTFRIDGVARLRERPVRPLTEALQRLGVVIDFEEQEGHAPLVVRGGRLPGGKVRLDASASRAPRPTAASASISLAGNASDSRL